jgi:hypothetical protein
VWRAETDDQIVATWDVPPERPKVTIRTASDGAIRSVSAPRWGRRATENFNYIPCGCTVHAERRFGDFVVPSEITVSWWFGRPQEDVFFRARLDCFSALSV